MVNSRADLVIEMARLKKLPTMFSEQGVVAMGGLASYGQNFHEVGRLSARICSEDHWRRSAARSKDRNRRQTRAGRQSGNSEANWAHDSAERAGARRSSDQIGSAED